MCYRSWNTSKRTVWRHCLPLVPHRQAWSPKNAPAPWGSSDHPPVTISADGEGQRFLLSWTALDVFWKQQEQRWKRNQTTEEQWIKHGVATPVWLLHVDLILNIKKKKKISLTTESRRYWMDQVKRKTEKIVDTTTTKLKTIYCVVYIWI